MFVNSWMRNLHCCATYGVDTPQGEEEEEEEDVFSILNVNRNGDEMKKNEK